MRYLSAVCILFLTLCGANADPKSITFPKDYEESLLNYLSLDRTNKRESARLFANEQALLGAQLRGDLPPGSLLVMEISHVKKSANGKPHVSSLGRFINDGKKAVFVMKKLPDLKGSASSNDNWEFAAFSPEGEFLNMDYKNCRSCHERKSQQNQVFSYEHLEKAQLFSLASSTKKRSVRAPEVSKFIPTKRKQGNTKQIYSENLTINQIIRKQLQSIKTNNAATAFSLAAPALRDNFKDDQHFLQIIKQYYPAVYDHSQVVFPELRKIRGSRADIDVVLIDPKNRKTRARYTLLKIKGVWRIAGCTFL